MDNRSQNNSQQLFRIPTMEHGQSAEIVETPLQGLYMDLLGCLGGSPSQTGVSNRKPMTGFSQILNMITDAMGEQQCFSTIPFASQDVSNSEPRIHEIFQHCAHSPNDLSQERLFTESLTSLHNGTSSIFDTQSTSTSTISPSEHANNEPEDPKMREVASNQTISGDGDDFRGPLNNFPQGTRGVIIDLEVTGVLKDSKNSQPETTHINPPTSNLSFYVGDEHITSREKVEAESWMAQSPLSIGGTMISNLLDNFVGVGFRRFSSSVGTNARAEETSKPSKISPEG